ncbi:MAG: MlaD family protein [Methylococcaceae bacterium]|nr:MlaD family protein [Methylococcaceae bacterium]MCI0668775.1 MlaD family protein [Methylococcaceae bacterium]
MGKETYALLTGLFVLTLGSALVAASIWLGHYGEERDVYLVVTQSSVSGLNPESTVLYRGVQVGKVSAISFDPMNSRNILVRIEVDKGLPITLGTYAMLRVQGLTGLAQIELGDSGENQQPLLTNNANPAQIPLQPSLIDKLADSGGNILLGSQELIAHLNDLLDDENLRRVKVILTNMETATGRLADLEERMEKAFVQVDQAAVKVKGAGEEVQAAGLKAQKTLTQFDSVARELGKLSGRIQTLAESANALALSGKNATDIMTQSTLPRLNTVLEELKVTSFQIRTLSGLLEKDPQMLLYGRQPLEPGPGEPGYQESR